MLKKLLPVRTLNKLLDESSTGLAGLRILGWSRFGLRFARYLSYCEKPRVFVRFRGVPSADLRSGLDGASEDERSVKAVLVEPSDPVEKVRPWYVTAVEADCALDVYLLSAAVRGCAMTIPRAVALVCSSLSASASVFAGGKCRTSVK